MEIDFPLIILIIALAGAVILLGGILIVGGMMAITAFSAGEYLTGSMVVGALLFGFALIITVFHMIISW